MPELMQPRRVRWPLPKKLSRGLRVPTPLARFLPLRIYIVLSSLSPLRSVKPTAGDAELPGYVLPSFPWESYKTFKAKTYNLGRAL